MAFSNDKRKLLTNFFSLSSVEAANYIFPLLTLPYLVRILGPDKFGLIAFAQAFAQYFVLITDYGFNLSATRSISISREDREKVNQIFSNVIFIKFIFMLASFCILVTVTALVPRFRQDFLLYVYSFGAVVGSVLFPIWFFQGMEKMKVIAGLNFLAKLVFVLAIFIFIKKQQDFIYVPLINSLGFMVSGLVSLALVFARFKIRFQKPSLRAMGFQLKDGWHVFISSAAISLYTVSNTFILGLLTNNTIVGYYSAAERVIRSSQRMLTPISQTLYPHISKLVADSQGKALAFIKKALVLIGGGSFAVSLGIFILAELIVNIFLGAQFRESVYVLRILAFLPFIIAVSNIFGIQTMLTFNMKEAFSKIIVTAGFINIPLALILVPFFKHIGMAVSVLVTELFVATSMFVYLSGKGLFRREVAYEKA